MKIVVFGASGRVGRRVVELLVHQGHMVFAVVHHNDPFQGTPNLFVKQMDVHDAGAVAAVLEESDAVISTLGSWGTKTGDVLSSAMESIIPAMKKHGVRRIVTLTGAVAFLPGEKPTLNQRLVQNVLKKADKRVIEDGEKHIQLLQASELDWTVLRSPVMMTLGKPTYQLADKLSGATASIHRQAVAQAMVDQIGDNTWLQQAPTIWRGSAKLRYTKDQ